ncbi:MAG: LUD domain-containing protein [Rhodovarius sp.]|nr:LUD domain-containing protein [Rhodovarius sp.]MCX7931077.1 LUD domain-containing protein [Rhodovarius sp.]MDW8313485.1 LUD domain-containing protein [Rhodovarius sp.]
MSREAILQAIRRGLRRGPLPADMRAMLAHRLSTHPRHLVPERARGERAELVSRFIAQARKEYATVTRVPELAAVPAAIADYLLAHNLPARFAMAPHPELFALPWAERPMLKPEARRAEPGDAAALTLAFAGIAETGTLMLPSGAERPTTLNLLPEHALVLLKASAILGGFEDAWDRLRARHRDPLTDGFMPRNVMLVTGPSRSADVEQTLELGAHGPRHLHIILVDDDSPSEA